MAVAADEYNISLIFIRIMMRYKLILLKELTGFALKLHWDNLQSYLQIISEKDILITFEQGKIDL